MSRKAIPRGTITPNQAELILSGLTESIEKTKTEMYVYLEEYGRIVLRAVKDGKCSRYDKHKVYAARDCCVLVNGVGYNTVVDYYNEDDILTPIMRRTKPSKEMLWLLNNVVKEHLSTMSFELHVVGGGFEIVEMEDYDERQFGVTEVLP